MSAAREAILESIRKRRGPGLPNPSNAIATASGDLVSRFIAKARASAATLEEIPSKELAPLAIWALLNSVEAATRVHLPSDSPLRDLPWHRAPGLMLASAPPSGEETAFAAADYALAETGTVAFLSGPRRFSSWHFLPGREIVLLHRDRILPRLEDLFTLVAAQPEMPATLNLVTGPSRTADVEQTIELGAHGPRHLHILLAG